MQFLLTFLALGCLSYFLFDKGPVRVFGRNRPVHGQEEEHIANLVEGANSHDVVLAMQRRHSFLENFNEDVVNAKRWIVIPGGGGSSGYPEWTKQRVKAAYHAYSHSVDPSNIAFLTLSAGSLNSPNTLNADGRIKFECQHMIDHLAELGVPRERILGDFMSWDTVSNGIYLRMFLEGLYSARKAVFDEKSELEKKAIRAEEDQTLDIDVYISDFHMERVKFVFEWVLDLHPPLRNKLPYRLHIHSVTTMGISWGSRDSFNKRVEHEQHALEQLRNHKKTIENIDELYAYILLGGHKGYNKYFHGEYQSSSGGGW